MATHEVVLETRLGSVYVHWVNGELTEVCLGELQPSKGDWPLRVTGEPPNAAGGRLVEDLGDYFSGKPVAFNSGTIPGAYSLFQQTVWKAAQQIPYGETRSYGWLAESMGRSKTAARAAGPCGRIRRRCWCPATACWVQMGR